MPVVRVSFTFLLAAMAAPAFAQGDAPDDRFAVTGSAAILSDYRLRGVSQTDKQMAVQGGVTLAHDSGIYAGAWGSNLSGWGTFGGANMEFDLIGGYRRTLGANGSIDVGATWYMYPGGADESDYAEPYAKLSGTRGPISLLAGIAYAPPQQALGRWYKTGASAGAGMYDDPGDKEDNLYLWGDGTLKLAGTPFIVKAHVGRSEGNPGLGPNATSAAPTGTYWDWSLGVDAGWKNLTFTLSYVDTDIGRREAALLQPSFSRDQDGTGSIADPTLVASLTANF
ncbi:TorF family putative porin [Allosphingosinicella deserti]|uniref:DUF481 domain-containing protein n=1 Tax=Allosphingosinicella deserti TaxID=2116704 RepID=A0A2P7QI80_9SPHN|nr:TorF family putative porin [Sphingomonas deserti]PSJ37678.1 hypothetical protein C7I55_21690 [Sphingomonas deserti]